MAEKVALIGSGNWGSAIATKLGKNALTNPMFDKEVKMWVFEEYVKKEGEKWVRPARGAKPPEGKTWLDEGYETLTGVINRLHENPIYLEGIPLPTSIVATPDVKDAVTGATMLIFVIPHNFLAPIVPKMEGAFAKSAVGISLIKGIEFEKNKPVLISDLLKKEMAKAEGNPSVDMSVLMGANVANEVAKGDFAEATIGCTDLKIGKKWCELFNTNDFKVRERALDPGTRERGTRTPIAQANAPLRSALECLTAIACAYAFFHCAFSVAGRSVPGCGRRRAVRRAQERRRVGRRLLGWLRLRRQHQGGHHSHRPQGDAAVLRKVLR